MLLHVALLLLLCFHKEKKRPLSPHLCNLFLRNLPSQ
jgi:hypothetical protein